MGFRPLLAALAGLVLWLALAVDLRAQDATRDAGPDPRAGNPAPGISGL